MIMIINVFIVTQAAMPRLVSWMATTPPHAFILRSACPTPAKVCCFPTSRLAVDHDSRFVLADKLYVADSENHCIRCVRLAEERVVTVAGTGLHS